MRHDEVVAEVKRSLDETASAEGGKRVDLKLSLPYMEHLGLYQYESTQNSSMEVYERNVESPYTFSIPAQVGRHVVYRNSGNFHCHVIFVAIQKKLKLET